MAKNSKIKCQFSTAVWSEILKILSWYSPVNSGNGRLPEWFNCIVFCYKTSDYNKIMGVCPTNMSGKKCDWTFSGCSLAACSKNGNVWSTF